MNLGPESSDAIVDGALQIVERAKTRGLVLRVTGAVGVRIHCPVYAPLHVALGRELSDLDFASYGKQSRLLEKFFQDLDYQLLRAAITPGLFEDRKIFLKGGKSIDVFLDRLHMSHTLEFKDRLEVDYPTIPLADLLLQKMQIIKINEKDVKDALVLLIEHEVGESDKETVRGDYIAGILSNYWGLYYTVTTNLDKLKSALSNYSALNEAQRSLIKKRIDNLLNYAEREPKTLKWKMRAKIGTKKKWYSDVEEVERAEWLGSH